jgi:intracellular septation protein
MSKTPTPPEPNSALADLGPLVVFFAFYKLRDIYWATGAFMIAVTVALGLSWLKTRKVRTMPVVTAVIVLFFGGMTIWLGDPRFIYIKPTIVASLMGLTLLGGLAFGRALLKPLIGSALSMTDEGWRILSKRFALMSLATAGLNELVWRSVTPERESLWVWFKFLGIPVITGVFLLIQLRALAQHMIKDPSRGTDRRT